MNYFGLMFSFGKVHQKVPIFRLVIDHQNGFIRHSGGLLERTWHPIGNSSLIVKQPARLPSVAQGSQHHA